MRANQFSLVTLMVAMVAVALLIAFPGKAVSAFAVGASLIVCLLVGSAMVEAVRTTERGEWRLLVPYSCVLLVGVLSTVFWTLMLLGRL